jgi:hypothetical protein
LRAALNLAWKLPKPARFTLLPEATCSMIVIKTALRVSSDSFLLTDKREAKRETSSAFFSVGRLSFLVVVVLVLVLVLLLLLLAVVDAAFLVAAVGELASAFVAFFDDEVEVALLVPFLLVADN